MRASITCLFSSGSAQPRQQARVARRLRPIAAHGLQPPCAALRAGNEFRRFLSRGFVGGRVSGVVAGGLHTLPISHASSSSNTRASSVTPFFSIAIGGGSGHARPFGGFPRGEMRRRATTRGTGGQSVRRWRRCCRLRRHGRRTRARTRPSAGRCATPSRFDQ